MIRGELVVVVPGRPAPKGSLKCVGTNGAHQLIEDNARTKPWRKIVATIAGDIESRASKGEPVGVEVTSTVPRPKAHYGTGANAQRLKDSAPMYPTGRRTGDADKLARLILDALQDAGILADDAQVVEVISRKAYPMTHVPDALGEPGAVIRVYPVWMVEP